MFVKVEHLYRTSSYLFLNGPIPASFVYFRRPLLITISIVQIEKSIDGVLGIQTRGRRMVGADNTMAAARVC